MLLQDNLYIFGGFGEPFKHLNIIEVGLLQIY